MTEVDEISTESGCTYVETIKVLFPPNELKFKQ